MRLLPDRCQRAGIVAVVPPGLGRGRSGEVVCLSVRGGWVSAKSTPAGDKPGGQVQQEDQEYQRERCPPCTLLHRRCWRRHIIVDLNREAVHEAAEVRRRLQRWPAVNSSGAVSPGGSCDREQNAGRSPGTRSAEPRGLRHAIAVRRAPQPIRAVRSGPVQRSPGRADHDREHEEHERDRPLYPA